MTPTAFQSQNFPVNPFFDQMEEIGKIVPVAIEKLITSVLVSPDSDDMLRDVVQGVCDRHELHGQGITSGINAPPSY